MVIRRSGESILLGTMFMVTLCLSASPARALVVQGFTDSFAPANWSLDPAGSNVDSTAAPTSIAITSPDDGSGNPGDSGFSIPLPAQSYALSFLWSYSTTDSTADLDLFGYKINGSFTPLSDPFGPTKQTGGISLKSFLPSDQFAFTMSSADNLGGSASTTISSFVAALPNEIPDCPCPVPGPLPILGLGAVFGCSRKLRKRIKTSKPEVISTI
jgi:hypothetical protein